jgi:hypothetical protein
MIHLETLMTAQVPDFTHLIQCFAIQSFEPDNCAANSGVARLTTASVPPESWPMLPASDRTLPASATSEFESLKCNKAVVSAPLSNLECLSA